MKNIQVKQLSERETLDVIEKFYHECLNFWKSEKAALKSVQGLTYNPYSVDGETLRQSTLKRWIKEHS